MESVPIETEEYILPDDIKEFKKTTDRKYDSSVCEGKTNRAMEGWAYYKITDQSFSLKIFQKNTSWKEANMSVWVIIYPILKVI